MFIICFHFSLYMYYSLDEHTYKHCTHCSGLTIFSTSQQSECDRWEFCTSWQVLLIIHKHLLLWETVGLLPLEWQNKRQMFSSSFYLLANRVKLIEWMWRMWLEKHSWIWRGDNEEWHKRKTKTEKALEIKVCGKSTY